MATPTDPIYRLRLYVSGAGPRSAKAIVNVRRLCERHLQGRYELEVIDIAPQPDVARREQIVAAPTLVKHLPEPVRRFIGDMSQTDRILRGIGAVPA
jgi:circadian clock protein KaiB